MAKGQTLVTMSTEDQESTAPSPQKVSEETRIQPESRSNAVAFEEGVQVVTNGRPRNLAQVRLETFKILKEQPQEEIVVPTLSGKNPVPYKDIGVNGVIYRIKRGVPVLVPQAISKAYRNTIRNK